MSLDLLKKGWMLNKNCEAIDWTVVLTSSHALPPSESVVRFEISDVPGRGRGVESAGAAAGVTHRIAGGMPAGGRWRRA